MNIEEIQKFCNSLKGVSESIKWEDHLCFCIGEKMFVVLSLSGKDTISFKVTAEQYNEMIEQACFEPAAYLARYKWVFMQDFNDIKAEELKDYIRQSYELVKAKLPKKLIKEIEASV